ncbi:MAG TPA: LuxR C-terminal-related transcriptional regulator [Anaerolineales bacterium]|nr:LuxR C-terminal-related transcriptional regulator [Anaerolineales bacterium]
MSLPLLATKFNLPPANPNQIRRDRLSNLLDQGLRNGHRLTLICAPTGYGKTTSVGQWIHQQKDSNAQDGAPARHFIWLTLDQGDNDLARFIAYLVAAFQQIQAGLGQSTFSALQNPRHTAPHVLATLLINELSVAADQIVLILDDYHTIHNQSNHDFMSYLIDHQPQQLHLVIVSRADPPLPLARLRARGQLTELRQLDLAMTRAEVSQFLHKLMDLEISPQELQVLESRTEGWAAGVQLAALSMRHVTDIPAFIQAFSGGHEYIADYLTGEVLEQQSQVISNFLLQTSILEQFSISLCKAVTGEAHAAQILQHLVETNLFLIPLDYKGEWYRYHALFADMLRKRLLQTHKEILPTLHFKAGQWYAQNNMLNQAVEHYLAGQNYDQAANQIEHNAEQMLMHGQTATFLRWLETFPVEHLFTHPVLLVYQGMANMLLGKIPDNALSLLQDITASAKKFQGEAHTLQALYSVMTGKALDAIRLSESALQNLPPERAFLRILAADSLAMAHALRGDMSASAQAFELVIQIAQQAGNVIMTLMGLSNLAGLRYQQGQLHQAREAYLQVLEISNDRLGGRSHALGKVLLGLGELAREWNDLESAYSNLSEAAEMFKQFVDIGLPMVYLAMTRVHIAKGEWDQAQAILEEARQLAQASKSTALDDSLTELMQARLWICLGELNRVEQWAHRRGLSDRPIDDLVAMVDRNATAFEVLQGEYLTLVRLHLAQKQGAKALEYLHVLLSHNEKRSQRRRVIEILALQAIALQQAGESEAASHTFARALELAEPEGYIRTFLDEGQPMAQLLYHAIAAGHSTMYASRLLAELTGQELSPALPKELNAEQHLVEPLSKRELNVLGLIAEGLTNQEIGLRLHISLSTVKGHTTHIYGKLGVNSRTQAVTRAQSLGLLPK